jgi:anti-anti-sigma factor
VNGDSRLEISREAREGAEVLTLRGELDLTNVDELSAAVRASRGTSIVLDLSRLVFVDSAGVRGIDAEHSRLRQEGRSLLVVAPPSSRAAWTFRIAGFADDFVLGSLGDAAEHVPPPSRS